MYSDILMGNLQNSQSYIMYSEGNQSASNNSILMKKILKMRGGIVNFLFFFSYEHLNFILKQNQI